MFRIFLSSSKYLRMRHKIIMFQMFQSVMCFNLADILPIFAIVYARSLSLEIEKLCRKKQNFPKISKWYFLKKNWPKENVVKLSDNTGQEYLILERPVQTPVEL